MAKAIDKQTVLDLIIEAKRADPETGSFAEWLAEYLVEHLPTLTPPNEWVSVDERLPEDDVSEHKVQIAVLVLTDRETVKIKNRTYHPEKFYYGKFYPERWDWGTFNDDRITHWMPLPKSPKEDK